MNEDKIINQAIEILEKRLKQPTQTLTNPKDVADYLKLVFNGLEYESFRVLYLNAQNQLIESSEMFKGTINTAAVYPREVVKAALSFNAAAVILAHNHPSGLAQPSSEDRQITDRLTKALSLIDVNVLDHFIIGGLVSYSFAENRIMPTP